MTSIAARSAIRATGLRKSYGEQVVLDGIDLEVAAGTVFALLGPNGAGKTTTVHILATLSPPTAARSRSAVTTSPRTPMPSAPLIGVTGQFSAVDGLFTGEENLRLMADLRHLGSEEGRGASRSCSSGSTSSTRPASPPRRTPAACAAGSTSR